ncbi:MAG: D-glycero-beta-D-manno-heptose 1,7-bisphosphate 7-phosphatase [Desulfobacterales bacterium]|nr:D-glycero-beta-D-manno-heptose 1,7-bisphosphate 7-phosphatase [Desulfobacterales bacterium]
MGIKKVVFLDRDGVINRDSPDYIKSWDEFEFFPGSLEAIGLLTRAGFDIIVITNQSVVNRKMVSVKELEYIFDRMTREVNAAGGRIKDIFFCPHVPQDQCDCRKPRPGLFYQAQQRYGLNLSGAYMVGDSAKDIESALRAGCGHALLVKTGNGAQAESILAQKNILPRRVVEDLYAAARWIVAHDEKHIFPDHP